ncbi:MAG: hypothetical protein K8R88_02640, partial [Armatimonadetes bacterium]|nr:hypothetical protein [Armatimonadota bacterium]
MSTGHLRIELLGRLRVVQAEGVVERFTTQKNAALLGALALEPGRKNLRDTLITQLWPDADEIPGRNRLNQAVSTLRKVLGEALCSDSGSLWLDAELVSTDVNEFRTEEDFATDLRSDTQANSLIKLVELYRGPLLEGVNEPWLNRERSLLEETYGTYLRTLVRFGVKSGDTAKILLFAQRLAVHDPLDVEAHSALMKLHLAQQRPQAVLRQYDELLKSLPPDFVPAREIDALVEKAHAMLTTGNLAGERTFVPKLPRFIDSFFGREAEIAELDALVSAGCRLITLHGTGGVGKTRLAVKFAASQIDRFKGRVAFVSGVGATNLDELKRAVIKVLSSAGNSDPANFDEVVHRLDGAQPFLVVLDSVEHLIEPLFKLQELLVKATGLYILVTSRRPLGLATEQVLAVTPLEGGADSPAVQLFCRRYSRLRENFEFREEDYVAVRQICENLQGLPIAIEMAAGWARLLSPEQIRVRLSKALGLTFESGRETSQLSALLGRSIELLGKERREKFRILCCFEADFALEA